MECIGRRAHWLDYGPRSMRQWATSPLAISLGLAPLDEREAARVPQRGRVPDFLRDGTLQPGCMLYVGQGHHSHRLRRTKWASPFVPGHDVSLDEWLPAYVQWVGQNLFANLKELEGQCLKTASMEAHAKQTGWQVWCLTACAQTIQPLCLKSHGHLGELGLEGVLWSLALWYPASPAKYGP